MVKIPWAKMIQLLGIEQKILSALVGAHNGATRLIKPLLAQ